MAFSNCDFDNNAVAINVSTYLRLDDCSFGAVVANTVDFTARAAAQITVINLTSIPTVTTSSLYSYGYLRANAGSDHKTWKTYGTYEKQSAVKYSGSNALLMNPTNASNELIAEATVFAISGETVAYSCYLRKSAAFAVLPYVKLSGAGITASTATMTDSTDTWELLTVSGVATANGFCKIEFVCQNGSGNVYVDDDFDSFTYWFEGDVPSVLPKPKLLAADVWNVKTSALTGTGSVGEWLAGLKNPNLLISGLKILNKDPA